MIKTNSLKNLNEFIKLHFKYQLMAFAMSQRANDLGQSGFRHALQIEAADAFVHTRRIMNYIMDANQKYQVPDNIIFDDSYDDSTITEIWQALITFKKGCLELTNNFSQQAAAEGDALTVEFLRWYLIDFAREIAENEEMLSYMKGDAANLYKVNRVLNRITEPDVPVVIKPFSPNDE